MLPYLLILVAFAADRLTKWWATNYLADTSPVHVHDYLTLYPTYNRGIAFGLMQGIGPIIGWLSIAVVIGLFIYMVRVPRSMWLLRIGLALIIGGAMGNLIDRVTAGQVLDFIQTPIRPGIFNVADIMINTGVVLSLLGAFLQREHPQREQEVLEVEEQPKV
jgi:signal peptidase II